MTVHRTITDVFEEDHDRLDTLFHSFRESKRQNFPKAHDAFQTFCRGLQRHILWEEELLFPLWEEKTGMVDAGPTVVMRAEHRRIGEQLEAIRRKLAERNSQTDQEEAALLELLGAHNLKEERVLYPSIDQLATPDECRDIFYKMKQIPEEWTGACCGAPRT